MIGADHTFVYSEEVAYLNEYSHEPFYLFDLLSLHHKTAPFLHTNSSNKCVTYLSIYDELLAKYFFISIFSLWVSFQKI